ncbi:hypothetical protein [Paenibacillus sp. 7516]|nr:hypothetical protein [Paenibacillus sp. 7516]
MEKIQINEFQLASAFMNESRILMLDEYTSALDALTESESN